jgi:hypothetical protein
MIAKPLRHILFPKSASYFSSVELALVFLLFHRPPFRSLVLHPSARCVFIFLGRARRPSPVCPALPCLSLSLPLSLSLFSPYPSLVGPLLLFLHSASTSASSSASASFPFVPCTKERNEREREAKELKANEKKEEEDAQIDKGRTARTRGRSRTAGTWATLEKQELDCFGKRALQKPSLCLSRIRVRLIPADPGFTKGRSRKKERKKERKAKKAKGTER